MEIQNRIIRELGREYPNSNSKQKRTYLLVICPECEEQYKSEKYTFMQGKSKMCKSCTSKIHNHSRTRLYRIWQKMKSRCYGNDKRHKIYYKDIEVCNDWKDNFISFKEWALKSGYKENLSIDRINNNGNYEPSNCRWATQEIQTRNTRKVFKHNTSGYRGVVKAKDKWCSQITINNKRIYLGRYDCRLQAAYERDNYIVMNNLEHTLNFERTANAI